MANVVELTAAQRREVLKRIRAIQYRYGLTRKEFSEVTGIRQRALERAVHGKADLSPKTLKKLNAAEEAMKAGKRLDELVKVPRRM